MQMWAKFVWKLHNVLPKKQQQQRKSDAVVYMIFEIWKFDHLSNVIHQACHEIPPNTERNIEFPAISSVKLDV